MINGQLSKSGMPFEVKSNNVMVFREQLVADFMEQGLLLERYHSACVQAKNFFQHQLTQQSPSTSMYSQSSTMNQSDKIQLPRVNIQLTINKSLMRAKKRLSKLSSGLDKTQKAISYEE